ncbi:putative aldouronate transport system substrate-binding protein [Pullulanibacillus pueri]|uniref:ABC transporter substrate-binding protein n=1 Tax=Pullulanibacillus pueri TaxID=1437324 RepID=A0A8J3EM63_9BACL|nr:extracellular solute-binding protein [Pullulanibacillus pueri]MBM7681654.1 putative aldouronate transport system substrate-binding protein [Pullulanibacillus pueri]GGH79294.1 ABC transporter substrate-binding protein [Pullulanibacillus pueri]
MRKLTMLLMTFVLFSGILIGCSSKNATTSSTVKDPGKNFNKTGYPIVNKKITLSMFGPLAVANDWDEREYFIEMEKKTNIHFDFETPDRADADTKKNLLLSSGDLPDIFYGSSFSHQDEIKYGEQGVIIPLEDLIKKYAPNIQKMLDQEPDIKKAITTPDGHIYSLPQVDEDPGIWHLWYNGEWLKNLGIKELPTTTDGLFDLLMKFKNDDPNKNGKADEIPLSTAGMDTIRAMFLGAFGVSNQHIELLNNKVAYGAIQPGYKEYLAYMNKLWKNNLLDHETFSQTDDQRKAKGHNDRLGLFPDARPSFTMNVDYDSTDNPVMNLVKAPGVDKQVFELPNKVSSGQFVITKDNKHPAESIRWADYSYSDEGADFLHNVKEGTYWEWKDDSKKVRVIKDPPKGFDDAETFRSSISPDWGIPVPIRRPAQADLDWQWDDNKFTNWLKNEEKQKLLPYGVMAYPQVYFTNEENKTVTRIEQDLNKYVSQMEAKFITGQEPLSKWDDYVKTIKKMNLDELLDTYQKAYDRYQK